MSDVTISRQEVAQIRALIDEIAQRARSDGFYMQQLKDAPIETLQAAGLPDGAIEDVLHEGNLSDAEVTGYMFCVITCWKSCWCTQCCITV